VDEKAIRNRPRPIPPNLPPPPEPEPEPVVPAKPAPLNREEPQLDEQEVNEWLALFAAKAKPKKKETGKARPSTPQPTPKPGKKIDNPHNLSPEDLAAWQDFADRENQP
jgi:protein TonB